MGSTVNNSVQSAYPRSVYVVGNDVYVSGYELNITHNQAKLWKNNVSTVLVAGTQTADAFSVFVASNDVYVAGYEYNGIINVPMLWKNGV